jgi:hypothetical protein
MISNDFADKIWETLITLVITAAICTSVVNLASRPGSDTVSEIEQTDNTLPPIFTSGYEALRF